MAGMERRGSECRKMGAVLIVAAQLKRVICLPPMHYYNTFINHSTSEMKKKATNYNIYIYIYIYNYIIIVSYVQQLYSHSYYE